MKNKICRNRLDLVKMKFLLAEKYFIRLKKLVKLEIAENKVYRRNA